MIRAFWLLSQNFGDCLNHYILTRIARDFVVYTELSAPGKKVVSIGSILNWCDENCIAWGPGLASKTDLIVPTAEYRAVRGPLSRQRALELGANVPPVYGDPGLLLPLIYKPKSKKKYRLGILPHYIDQNLVFPAYAVRSRDVHIIDVLDTPENVIDSIFSCEKIVSSSLHGIIAAHAYNIPVAWVEFSDAIGGDGMKYVDHFMAVDIDITEAVDLRDRPGITEILERCAAQFETVAQYDPAPLLESAPFKIKRRILNELARQKRGQQEPKEASCPAGSPPDGINDPYSDGAVSAFGNPDEDPEAKS